MSSETEWHVVDESAWTGLALPDYVTETKTNPSLHSLSEFIFTASNPKRLSESQSIGGNGAWDGEVSWCSVSRNPVLECCGETAVEAEGRAFDLVVIHVAAPLYNHKPEDLTQHW